MAIDLVCTSNLDDIAADAAGALDRDQQASLFDRLSWYQRTLEYCPPSGTPLFLRARDDSGNTAWLFLMRQGRRATVLTCWYSFETGLVFKGAREMECAEAIARYLRKNISLDVVTVSPLPEDRLKPLLAAFRATGWLAQSDATSVNWTCAIKGGWAAYWNTRPARLRNTVERKMRTDKVSTEILQSVDDLSWKFYQEIYDESWKPTEGSSAFLRDLAEEEAKAGTLRLGLAYADGNAIAAQLWLVENGKATIHKLAHREASRALSPGSILSAAMFRHVIEEDKVQMIDFGTGNDAYKADWMDQAQPLYTLQMFNPASASGLIGALKCRFSALVHRRRSH